MTFEFARKGADTAPGAGRLLAGSIKSPELASSLVLRLPASCWENVAPLPDVLGLPAGTAGFFLRTVTSLSSLRRADEIFKVEIALIKANSSCLSMTLQQEHSEHPPVTPLLYFCCRISAETSAVNSLLDQST